MFMFCTPDRSVDTSLLHVHNTVRTYKKDTQDFSVVLATFTTEKGFLKLDSSSRQ